MRTTIIASLFLLLFTAAAGAAQVGSPAPSFSLRDGKGKTVTLTDFKGKVLFLDFWATWCRVCREELPELDRLYKQYGRDGFEVVAISMDSSDARVAAFLQKVAVTFLVLKDKGGGACDAYAVSSLPTGFIVSWDGIIRYVHKGYGKEFLPVYEKEIIELLKQH